MSFKSDLLADLRNGVSKPFDKTHFLASKVYYSPDGYKLSHFGTWRLTFKKTFLFSESDKSFWPFVELLKFKPYEMLDTVEEPDNNFDGFIIDEDGEPKWVDDEDTNFVPSYGRDLETGIVGSVMNCNPGYRKKISFVA